MQELSWQSYAADVADFHGLKHIAKPDTGIIRRLLWTFFFLGSLTFGLYEIIQCIIYFAEFHHITKMEVNYTTKVEFPAVTICNVNKYRQSALTVDDIAHVGVHLGIVDDNYDVIDPHLYTDDFVNRMNAVNWSSISIDDNDYNMTNLTYRTGHQVEDMLLECEFSGDECSVENFTHVFTHLGNCFTFNKWEEDKPDLISKRAGAANGLKLVLDIETWEYTPSNDLDGDALDAALKVLVHPTNEPPFVKELGFGTPPGFHSFISIKKEQIFGLPSPYGECLESGIVQYYDHYSLTACRIELETQAVEEYCGCRLVEQPGDGSYPVCTANQTHGCAHQTLVDYVNGDIELDVECSDPCDIEDYPHTISLSKLRTNFVQKLYEEEHNLTAEYITDNVVAINIYYEALNMQTITQIPDTNVIVLISQIGGNLGLCIGASILTVIQLFEFIIDWLVSKTCKAEKSKIGNSAMDTTELNDSWQQKELPSVST